MIVSLVHSGVEERNQVIMLTYVRGRLWSFMMFVSSQPKCSVSVFTLNKVNRNHGCRLILFKPNLIQIFHGLNLFLWDIWGEVYLDSCTTGASAESTGFWFLLNVECWFSACSRVSLTRSHTLPEFWFCRKTDISVVKKRKWSYVRYYCTEYSENCIFRCEYFLHAALCSRLSVCLNLASHLVLSDLIRQLLV